MDIYVERTQKDRYLLFEFWLWIGIFVMAPITGIQHLVNVEPWLTMTRYIFATMVTIALITKVLKMRAINKRFRAVVYGVLLGMTVLLFFTPWYLFI